jgi:hypothetical protein
MVGNVVWTTLIVFGLREILHRAHVAHGAIVADARERLGREPTKAEVKEQYARRWLRRKLGREPTGAEVERALAGFGDA